MNEKPIKIPSNRVTKKHAKNTHDDQFTSKCSNITSIYVREKIR